MGAKTENTMAESSRHGKDTSFIAMTWSIVFMISMSILAIIAGLWNGEKAFELVPTGFLGFGSGVFMLWFFNRQEKRMRDIEEEMERRNQRKIQIL